MRRQCHGNAQAMLKHKAAPLREQCSSTRNRMLKQCGREERGLGLTVIGPAGAFSAIFALASLIVFVTGFSAVEGVR